MANKFELPLGEGNSLAEFEDIVIGMIPGQTTARELMFSKNFINNKLDGQTVDMRVTLHAIKVRELPEVNDEFARSWAAPTAPSELRS